MFWYSVVMESIPSFSLLPQQTISGQEESTHGFSGSVHYFELHQNQPCMECVALQEEYSFNEEKAFSNDIFPFPDEKNVSLCYQKVFRLNIH
jgi:hypothetical protein